LLEDVMATPITGRSGETGQELVAISALLPADSPRFRQECAEQIEILRESPRAFDPIVAHRATMRVIDGMQRLHAARARGQTQVEVRYFDGSAEDAFVLAVELNVHHGLPLTLAERKAATERIMDSHPQWSDRAIAARTGLSAGTVRTLREARRTPRLATRVGRDGRSRPVDPTVGRQSAAQLLQANPRASLREIAREAGVSPGTVRSVRDTIHRAELPPARPPRPDLTATERVRPGLAAAARLSPESSDPPAAPTPRLLQRPQCVTERLARDPSLRSTDLGRLLLRMLTMTTRAPWENFGAIVPEHLTALTHEAALEQAVMWNQFAELIKERRRQVS